MDIIIEATTENFPIDLLLQADPAEDLVKEYLGRGITFVAKASEDTVGVLVLLRTRPGTMEIMNVSVREEYQNRGIGKKLILVAVAYAKKEKIRMLEIGTGNPGVKQMLLYQKCGFRIVGVEPDYFRKQYREVIIENGIECRDLVRLRLDL